MTSLVRIAALVALASSLHAESLLVPRIVGDWQPLDASLTAQEIAEVEPGHFYLFRAQTDPKQPGTRGGNPSWPLRTPTTHAGRR